MIKIDGVKKTFENNIVLNNASFEIDDNSFIGLYGKSGSGKSTLAKIICGVLAPDQGQIYINNTPLYSAKNVYDRKVGIKIQMVYQHPFAALDPTQRIKAGFIELIKHNKLAFDKKDTEKIIEDIALELGIENDILQHLPHQISGGEAQRIAIAKCLLFKPELLILDEATSMLDASTQANIIGLVTRAMKNHGGSVLMISHDKILLSRLCSKIACIDDNKNIKIVKGSEL